MEQSTTDVDNGQAGAIQQESPELVAKIYRSPSPGSTMTSITWSNGERHDFLNLSEALKALEAAFANAAEKIS